MFLSSRATRLRPALPALLLGLQSQIGCADARGRFEDFHGRLHATEAGAPTNDGGPCVPPAPGQVNGPALLALETSLTPAHPILLLGTIDTPELEGTTAVHFAYRALDASDRKTLVGDTLEVGPYPLHDGKLNAKVPELTLDGNANPILHGAPVTSEMTLTGDICGVRDFYCGTLTGTASGLVNGPFTGHFAITRLPLPDAVPARPRFGCDPDDFAEPLGL